MSARVLVLDHRDSFVFNLVDELLSAGARVETIRTGIPLATLHRVLGALDPHLVVLSPGPGRPEECGVTLEWLRAEPAVPILGICLGHQAMAVAAGGDVGPAPAPVHGRRRRIEISPDEPVFEGYGEDLVAARYHSLVVTRVPESMRVVATCLDAGVRLVMALRHRRLCRLGLQFHPESILTPLGPTILRRFLEEAIRYRHGGGAQGSSWSRVP